MRLLFMSAAASLLAVGGADASEWYLVGRAGSGHAAIFNSHYDSRSITPKPTFARLSDDDGSRLVFMAIAAGHTPSTFPFRLEVEISYWGNIDWVESYNMAMPGIAGRFDLPQSAAIISGMLNVYYDHPLSPSFTVFAGLGAGAARVETRSVRGFGTMKALDVQPLANLSLGGTYSLTERWGLEVRGTTTTSLDLDFEPQTRGWTQNRADISLSSISIGVRRHF